MTKEEKAKKWIEEETSFGNPIDSHGEWMFDMLTKAHIAGQELALDGGLVDVRLSLPDNNEIEKESECLVSKYQKLNDTLGLGFGAGAKWMRDEVINRNGSFIQC